MCGRIYASLARSLAEQGHVVTGSDDRPMPPVSDYLIRHGLRCAPTFSVENLNPATDLVLTGTYYGIENIETAKARELGIPISNFARFLGENYLQGTRNAVVVGSYGKTTTSSMLAWILEQNGRDPGWLVGGVSSDLGDYLRLREHGCWVLEGDEYRSGPDDPAPKFHYYNPEIVIVTALDHVHQDQFDTMEEAVALFADFISTVKESGAIFAADDPLIRSGLASHSHCPFVTVGFSESADIPLSSPIRKDGRTSFIMKGVEFSLSLRGGHSCVNAALAASAAEALGVPLKDSASALLKYRGIKERQEVLIDSQELTIIHDSGIYPKSIAKVVSGIADSVPGRRLCVLFHPRYTLGDPEMYYREIAHAFCNIDCFLVADAVNFPGIQGAFDFSLDNLMKFLPERLEPKPVGPAMKCFENWRKEVLPGDVWLILVEPMFPEPVASIRSYIQSAEMSRVPEPSL